MSKLEILRGVPASGKSTYANKLVREGGFVRVNRDDIRMAMFGKPWGVDEDMVTRVEHAQVDASLAAGSDVVVDATNFNHKAVSAILRIAACNKAEVNFTDFPISADIAVARDTARGEAGGRAVSESVIRGFFKRYKIDVNGGEFRAPPEVPDYGPNYTRDALKPTLYTFDLDGTLALHTSGRSPYDSSRYMEDTLNESLYLIMLALRDLNETREVDVRIGILSGRSKDHWGTCVAWLDEHGVPWDYLWMRASGDDRGDDIVKTELFDQGIAPSFDHQAHWDDRSRVVRALRSKGITVHHVISESEGNF